MTTGDGVIEGHWFSTFEAFSQNGGNDTADIYDAYTDDTFNIEPNHATVDMASDGDDEITLHGFHAVYAHADNGGVDTAEIYDSTVPLPVIETDMTVSGYYKGIVGVVIDVDDLPQGVTIDAADFQFRVGNTVETSTWSAAPAPSNIIVHEGEGENGADRIEIAWAEDSVLDQWLEVTVLASGDVGVPVDDVFYFGSRRGDANGDGVVDSIDLGRVGINYGKQDPNFGFSEGDFDLDGDVDADDLNTVQIGWGALVDLPIGSTVGKYLYHKLDGSDELSATPTETTLVSNVDGAYEIVAYNFETVNAYSRLGNDTVYFYGSESDDVFESRYDYSSLTGSGFSNTVYGFDEVYADLGQGGSDVVHLYDSSGDDMLSADDDWAQMTRAIGTLLCQVSGLDALDTVFAHHSDGDDDDDIATPLYALDLTYWV